MSKEEESAIGVELRYIRKDISEIKEKLNNEFVSHDEFWPVKMIAYGASGIILTGAFVALIGLVVK